MVVFKSLVVFDSETTSLPQLDHNTTKITELAFIGCEVEHFKKSQKLPRVLHKLVLPFNPEKTIAPGATNVSGLSNELLENVKPFREEDVDMLKNFISHLPSPVCLVAHNGNKFDFPILRRTLEKLNKDLQNNVYCADSLVAFQNLLPKTKETFWTRRNHCETTPTNSRTQQVNFVPSKKVSRVLFPDEEIFSGNVNIEDRRLSSQSSSGNLSSYKLKDIYYFIYGAYFPDAHRAECDANALLDCIIKCDGFLDWMNENAVIFNSITPLF